MKKFLQAVILYENNEIHIIHEFNVGDKNITLIPKVFGTPRFKK